MSVKERLHQLVEQLPEGELQTARRFLEYLRSPQTLADEMDEEPLSAEAVEGLPEAEEGMRRGDHITLEEYERKRGR